MRDYFTCVFRISLDYGIRVFEEKDKIRMDGDNLCRVMNSLSIIASEKIREELSLGMREIIPFLSVILL